MLSRLPTKRRTREIKKVRSKELLFKTSKTTRDKVSLISVMMSYLKSLDFQTKSYLKVFKRKVKALDKQIGL